MYAFVCCCLLKRMSYNKEIKREAESERNLRSKVYKEMLFAFFQIILYTP